MPFFRAAMHAFLQDIAQQLVSGIRQTSAVEFVAVFFGITSVVFSRQRSIWVYPTGLVNTALYIYLSVVAGLYAEASVNLYYTVMGVVGWAMWSKKREGRPQLRITRATPSEWLAALLFFGVAWLVLYGVLAAWTDSTVPVADSFASATAYTAMWLLTRKKLENWLWWIATNIAAIPLYFVKGFVFTALQYLVFLALAVSGYFAWSRALAREERNSASASGDTATATN